MGGSAEREVVGVKKRVLSAAGRTAIVKAAKKRALTGLLVDRTAKFLAPLAITVVVLMAGGLSWVLAVGQSSK